MKFSQYTNKAIDLDLSLSLLNASGMLSLNDYINTIINQLSLN